MTEECCMEIKDMVEYWNYWNKQKDYKVAPDEFAYQKASDTTGYFETILDIANAFVFLASDEASYITGVVLSVDGLARS